MVVLNVVTITLGQVITYAIDQACYEVSHGWRRMVELGAVPAGAQLGFLFSLPESLRILILRERLDDAKQVLGRVCPYATPEQADPNKLRTLPGWTTFLGSKESSSLWR